MHPAMLTVCCPLLTHAGDQVAKKTSGLYILASMRAFQFLCIRAALLAVVIAWTPLHAAAQLASPAGMQSKRTNTEGGNVMCFMNAPACLFFSRPKPLQSCKCSGCRVAQCTPQQSLAWVPKPLLSSF